MIYDVVFFISKFKAIPEYNFCRFDFVKKEKRCVNGWCGLRSPYEENNESEALCNIMKVLSCARNQDDPRFPKYSMIAAEINNGEDIRYQQPTPKQRILAALNDIKKLQEGEAKKVADPKPLHIYHAVQIPETLVEKGKELVTLN